MNTPSPVPRPVRVVFLDMDGVVNSRSFYESWIKEHHSGDEPDQEFMERYYYHDGFEGYIVPELLDRLVRLCDETDASIVWTSSWRDEFDGLPDDDPLLKRCWLAKGLPYSRLIGRTPSLSMRRMDGVARSVEIEKWIRDHSCEYNLLRGVILDDDPEAGPVSHPGVRFFQTTWEDGLTEEIAEKAREWLLGSGE